MRFDNHDLVTSCRYTVTMTGYEFFLKNQWIIIRAKFIYLFGGLIVVKRVHVATVNHNWQPVYCFAHFLLYFGDGDDSDLERDRSCRIGVTTPNGPRNAGLGGRLIRIWLSFFILLRDMWV